MAAPGGRRTGGCERLLRRSDFIAAAGGRKAHCALLTLQMRRRGDAAPARLGLTITRRVGTATERNRIRRRLRAAAAPALVAAEPGCDYVIVARREILGATFVRVVGDLARAVRRVHGIEAGRTPAREKPGPAGA